jgi:hypothetical protein
MKDEELVAVMVPKSRLAEVYALLGSEPSAEPRADDEIIEQAVQESSEDTRRFLRLLAVSRGEWLSIEDVRDRLGLGVHNLAGVLSTLPRRWRGRYGQSAPLPFEVEGQGSERRYRMDPEVAEIVMQAPAPAQPRTWTLESFEAAMLDEDHGGGGPDAVTLLHDGLAWSKRWHGDHDFGTGASGPMYLMAPDLAREPVNVLSCNLAGDVGVRYIGLKKHLPFDEEAERRDLTERLNEIGGIDIPDGRWNGKAFNVKLEHLRSPDDRAAFFRVFDDVARRVAEHASPPWTKEKFLVAAANEGPSVERLARDTMEWNRRHGVEVVFGEGRFGPLYLQARAANGELVKIASVRNYGHAIVNYELFKHLSPFDRVEDRVELSRRLNSIPGVEIPEQSAVEGLQPTIAPEALATEAAQGQFFEVFDWVAARLLEGK